MVDIDLLTANKAFTKRSKWPAPLVGLKCLVKMLCGHINIIAGESPASNAVANAHCRLSGCLMPSGRGVERTFQDAIFTEVKGDMAKNGS